MKWWGKLQRNDFLQTKFSLRIPRLRKRKLDSSGFWGLCMCTLFHSLWLLLTREKQQGLSRPMKRNSLPTLSLRSRRSRWSQSQINNIKSLKRSNNMKKAYDKCLVMEDSTTQTTLILLIESRALKRLILRCFIGIRKWWMSLFWWASAQIGFPRSFKDSWGKDKSSSMMSS